MQGCQSSKINTLRDTLLKHTVDFLGLAEVNKDWRKVPHEESLWTLTDGWFEHRRLSTSINSQVPPTRKVQTGGTALLAINKVAYSIIAQDIDPRKLGRWTSMLLKGKNQHKCRIVCIYCPCISTGPTSTYALQTIALTNMGILECPRTQFWQDLRESIMTWQSQNEQVIIMGDWNSEYQEVITWMKSFGLVDIIHSRHPSETPPPTCNRSRHSPIDVIFAPEDFKSWRGGFLAFDYLEGDHRGIWCDIPIEYILGYNIHHPSHAKARRLKVGDPRVRTKYLNTLHRLLRGNNIYDRFQRLYDSAQATHVLPIDIMQFEDLDEEIVHAMEAAEQQCRKLKTGITKWSPLYQRACDKVTYWKLILCQL